MSKHTPGPWQVNHTDASQVCDCDGEVRGWDASNAASAACDALMDAASAIERAAKRA